MLKIPIQTTSLALYTISAVVDCGSPNVSNSSCTTIPCPQTCPQAVENIALRPGHLRGRCRGSRSPRGSSDGRREQRRVYGRSEGGGKSAKSAARSSCPRAMNRQFSFGYTGFIHFTSWSFFAFSLRNGAKSHTPLFRDQRGVFAKSPAARISGRSRYTAAVRHRLLPGRGGTPHHETYVPAKRQAPQAEARVSHPDANPRRSRRGQEAPAQRPAAAHCVASTYR